MSESQRNTGNVSHCICSLDARGDKMASLKWTLIFLYLRFNVSHPSWTIDAPSSVKGLLGSCVVIPCSYDFPDPGKKLDKFTGMWLDDAKHHIVHTAGSNVLPQYLNRTKLTGNLSLKKCSLKIDPLQQSDQGPFAFRIEIATFDNFSYYNGKVSITTLSDPDPIHLSIKEEEATGAQTASCSVLHSCPISPPVLKWNHPGEKLVQTQTLEGGQFMVTSDLTFHPTRVDHNKTLRCSVKYHGGLHRHAEKVINVKYAPVNVEVEHQPTVREGESVRMTCSGDAHPAVSSYEWYDGNGARLHTRQEFVLQNVSRHQSALYCTASNTEGRGKSSPVLLNVLYAPDVQANSSCLLEVAMTTMKCECIVDSNPPSTVQFMLADRVVPSTELQVRGSITTGTLEVGLRLHTLVTCLANNTQGAASHSIPLDNTLLILIIAVGVGVLFILLLIVGAFIHWRRTRATSVPHLRPDNVDLAGVEKNCPNDQLCTKACACDEPVYGNVPGNCNEPVYANMFD
ncbi:B-cell receptor CD22 isoform X2 [Nelusetta ayraudi]|uniref:B-cell receptor CD22 isoform X2 n=1 Tax=Nelusetta ayraudi TaxID=303726 RepID=UPI003F719E4B